MSIGSIQQATKLIASGGQGTFSQLSHFLPLRLSPHTTTTERNPERL